MLYYVKLSVIFGNLLWILLKIRYSPTNHFFLFLAEFSMLFNDFPSLSQIALGILGSGTLLYIAYQKRVFSKDLTRTLSSFFFYPTVPISISIRLGNYWNVIDGWRI